MNGFWITLAAACLASAAPPPQSPEGEQDSGFLAALPRDGAENLTHGGQAFLEVLPERRLYYRGETMSLRLRVGFAEDFVANGLVQIFQRPLDLPAQVQADWLELVEWTLPERGPTLALGSRRARWEETQDGARLGGPWKLVELSGLLEIGPSLGEELSAPVLRFAYATSFRESAFTGRVAEDRHDALVLGSALDVRILELPEEGRPPEYSGAIGRFQVSSRLEGGESQGPMRLFLDVLGHGRLEGVQAPRLRGMVEVAFLGVRAIPIEGGMRFSYELERKGDTARRFPSMNFVYFDPLPGGGYRTEVISPGVLPQIGEPESPAVGARRSKLPYLLLALVVWVIFRRVLGRRGKGSSRESRGRLDQLAQDVQGLDGTPRDELLESLVGALAGALRCTPQAIIGPGLSDRLSALGLQARSAEHLAHLVEQLSAERYGGPEVTDAHGRLRGMLGELRDPTG